MKQSTIYTRNCNIITPVDRDGVFKFRFFVIYSRKDFIKCCYLTQLGLLLVFKKSSLHEKKSCSTGFFFFFTGNYWNLEQMLFYFQIYHYTNLIWKSLWSEFEATIIFSSGHLPHLSLSLIFFYNFKWPNCSWLKKRQGCFSVMKWLVVPLQINSYRIMTLCEDK